MVEMGSPYPASPNRLRRFVRTYWVPLLLLSTASIPLGVAANAVSPSKEEEAHHTIDLSPKDNTKAWIATGITTAELSAGLYAIVVSKKKAEEQSTKPQA